jgi:transcriptional regulator with XRE-family HTH domain
MKNKQIIMALLAKGWTQRELARRTNIHETKLSAIVNGWLNPSYECRQKIANILERQPSELFQ